MIANNIKFILQRSIFILFLSLSLFGLGSKIETIGPSLPQEIMSFYVPPTQSDEPYAATADSVFRYNKKNNQWNKIYSTSLADKKILGICGYAKSSQVLYVVHSKGGARTKNSGQSWNEFILTGFSQESGKFIKIIVNPKDRKQAILAYQKKAWITDDYAESLNSFPYPSESEEISDVGYTGGDNTHLVIITSNALYYSSDYGKSWVSLLRSLQGPDLLALSPIIPCAFVAADKSSFRAYDLLRPGFQSVYKTDLSLDLNHIDTDCAFKGLIWGANEHNIFLIDLQSTPIKGVSMYKTDKIISSIKAHPGLFDACYWSEDNQLYLMKDSFSGKEPTLPASLDLSTFTKSPYELLSQQVGNNEIINSQDAYEKLNSLMVSQPPLEEVIGAALKHSHFSDGEVNSWKKKLRSRNLMPTLKLGYGVREYPVSRSETIENVDRYGVSKTGYVRLDDEIENLDSYSISLTWDLTKLFYDPEQIDVNKEKREEANQRNQLIFQITNLYYERLEQIMKIKLATEKMNLQEKISIIMGIRRISDLLNGLCGSQIFVDKLE